MNLLNDRAERQTNTGVLRNYSMGKGTKLDVDAANVPGMTEITHLMFFMFLNKPLGPDRIEIEITSIEHNVCL